MSGTSLYVRSPEWSSMRFTAVSDREAGDMIEVEARIGMVVEDTATGESGVIIYRCDAIVAPKEAATGINFATGDKVYYNRTNGNVTTISSGNVYVGTSNEDAGNTDESLEIDLKGDNSQV